MKNNKYLSKVIILLLSLIIFNSCSDYLDKEKVVLAGLIHNTHLTETEINKVIKALNIKVGK